MADRIQVIARVRPQSKRELSLNDPIVSTISIDHSSIQLSTSNNTRSYKLDQVVDVHEGQEHVFKWVSPLLDDVLQGYNGSLFTYGQTGTGKTHTMLGYDLWGMAQENHANNATAVMPDISKNPIHMGVIPRSMEYVFQSLENLQQRYDNKLEYHICLSYIEIYNDKIIDLLNIDQTTNTNADESFTKSSKNHSKTPTKQSIKSLEIRENRNGEIIIPNLTEVEVENIDQVFEILWCGAEARCVAATDMNDYSSRSHTIFQVKLEIIYPKNSNAKNNGKGIDQLIFNKITTSKLNLIDLAGSEKWKSFQMTNFTQERIKELTSINRSLSALGNCISALMKQSNNNSNRSDNNNVSRNHIPYRDSKLTRLLQDSLNGNTKILFIVTLSPSYSSLEETISTLQFADRAMKVQIFATSNMFDLSNNNEKNSDALSPINEEILEKSKQEILNLKSIIQTLMKAIATSGNEKLMNDIINQQPIKNILNNENSSKLLNENTIVGSELIELQNENYSLSQKLLNSMEEITFLQSCINKWPKNSDKMQDDNLKDEDDNNAVMQPPKEIKFDLNNLIQTPDAFHERFEQLGWLIDDIQKKSQIQQETDLLQEERWQSLLIYHTWLQSQTQMRKNKNEQIAQLHANNNSNTNSTLEVKNSFDEDDELLQRVLLLETSNLYLSEELQRSKSNFLRVNNNTLEKLNQTQRENLQLQNEISELSNQLEKKKKDQEDLQIRFQLLKHERLSVQSKPINGSSSSLTSSSQTILAPKPPSHPPAHFIPAPSLNTMPFLKKSVSVASIGCQTENAFQGSESSNRLSTLSYSNSKKVYQSKIPRKIRAVHSKSPSNNYNDMMFDQEIELENDSFVDHVSKLIIESPQRYKYKDDLTDKASGSISPTPSSPDFNIAELEYIACSIERSVSKDNEISIMSYSNSRSKKIEQRKSSENNLESAKAVLFEEENNSTGESQLLSPEEIQGNFNNLDADNFVPENNAKDKYVLHARRGSKKPKPLWREYCDEKTGNYYYFNKLHNLTTWNRPSDEEMALMVLDGQIIEIEK
eukprot:gene12262-16442_t